jgi:integrase/recombinase XerD
MDNMPENLLAEAVPCPATRQSLARADDHSPDDKLIDLWLHGRPDTTIRAYRRDISRLRESCPSPLGEISLGELQAFADSLAGSAPSSKRRTLAAVKSLFRFCHMLGAIPFDTARALRSPHLPDDLASRILTVQQVRNLIAAASAGRNRVLLTILYAAGLRVSECVALTWRDTAERAIGGQLTVFGKGGKSRAVLLPAGVWADLIALRGTADDAPVFVSRKRGHLRPFQVDRIIKAAGIRAGIAKDVSPHTMRHAMASHSLDAGAPIHVVQATLGHASLMTTGRYAHVRPGDSAGLYLAL